MRVWSYVIGAVALLALLGIVPVADSQEAANQPELLKQASIVFSGTVTQLGATTMAAVPRSAQTIVVHVDAVVKKPAAVSLRRGDSATVEVRDPAAFQEGTHATFYTEGWIFGAGLAVRELGHQTTASEMVAPTEAQQRALGKVQEEASDQALKERMSEADYVVVARVTEVRRWNGPKSKQYRVTEHDPDWHDAVIQVEATLKGPKPKKNRLVVRYPQCNDVAWVHSPKFEKNQRGVFFLKKDDVSGQPTALVGGSKVSAYTCLSPGDWLPMSEEARVKAALAGQH